MKLVSIQALLLACLLIGGCKKATSPCDDKLVVLEGNGSIQVESQWDACVAKNASKIASNALSDNRLAEIALELCEPNASRYANALRAETPQLPSDQLGQLVEYKREALFKIAKAEMSRARSLRCEAK